MISDRHYMRSVGPNSGLAPLFWLIGILVGVYVIQMVAVAFVRTGIVTEWFALSPEGVAKGRIWTLVTFGFMHDTRGIWHLLINTLMLFFLGRIILPTTGARRFLTLFLVTTAVGGLFWLGVNFTYGGTLVGASAAVLGLLVYFCCQSPNERVTLLLFFVIPVTVVPKYLALVLAGIELLLFLFWELRGPEFSTGIAHSAHLGGMLAAMILYRVWSGSPEGVSATRSIELPKWMRTKRANPDIGGSYRVNVSQGRDMKREVDRILDKINHSGFGSLTPEEKRTLDEARDTLGKR